MYCSPIQLHWIWKTYLVTATEQKLDWIFPSLLCSFIASELWLSLVVPSDDPFRYSSSHLSGEAEKKLSLSNIWPKIFHRWLQWKTEWQLFQPQRNKNCENICSFFFVSMAQSYAGIKMLVTLLRFRSCDTWKYCWSSIRVLLNETTLTQCE